MTQLAMLIEPLPGTINEDIQTSRSIKELDLTRLIHPLTGTKPKDLHVVVQAASNQSYFCFG